MIITVVVIAHILCFMYINLRSVLFLSKYTTTLNYNNSICIFLLTSSYFLILAVVQNKRGLDAPCHKNMFAAAVAIKSAVTRYILKF